MKESSNGKAPRFSRVEKRAVTNAIIDQVASQVRAGQLGPGDRLPTEHQLVEIFGVSRSSVREALKALEVLGIVERAQDGSRIRAEFPLDTLSHFLSSELIIQRLEVANVYQARRILEVELGALATRNVTDDDLEVVEALLVEMERCGPQEVARYREIDRTFHQSIGQLAGNPILIRMWEVAYDLYSRLRFSVPAPQSLEVSNARHRRLFAALASRDEARMRATVQELLVLGEQELTQRMASVGSSS